MLKVKSGDHSIVVMNTDSPSQAIYKYCDHFGIFTSRCRLEPLKDASDVIDWTNTQGMIFTVSNASQDDLDVFGGI